MEETGGEPPKRPSLMWDVVPLKKRKKKKKKKKNPSKISKSPQHDNR
jgi:hypothetical protein